jgi:hypothetical protein
MEGAQTLLAAQGIVATRGGTFRLVYQSGAMISVVRNVLVAQFLKSEADLLLMLDSDQAIGADVLERMIDLDQPVVGCIYPKRGYDWSKTRLDTAADINQILYQASEYVGWLQEDQNRQVCVVNGFARAEHVGTGVLLVQRRAFQQLMTHFPELEGLGFGKDLYPHLKHNWGFFNSVFRDDGLPLSEDISFCRRWHQSGGEIWADVTSDVDHVGRHTFRGNYLDFLNATAPE